MTDKRTLSDLLRAEPEDCGCDAGMLVLDQYVELECAGQDPSARFPALAAHLRACPACRVDYGSLLRYVRE
jgi:hypothetical protein